MKRAILAPFEPAITIISNCHCMRSGNCVGYLFICLQFGVDGENATGHEAFGGFRFKKESVLKRISVD